MTATGLHSTVIRPERGKLRARTPRVAGAVETPATRRTAPFRQIREISADARARLFSAVRCPIFALSGFRCRRA